MIKTNSRRGFTVAIFGLTISSFTLISGGCSSDTMIDPKNAEKTQETIFIGSDPSIETPGAIDFTTEEELVEETAASETTDETLSESLETQGTTDTTNTSHDTSDPITVVFDPDKVTKPTVLRLPPNSCLKCKWQTQSLADQVKKPENKDLQQVLSSYLKLPPDSRQKLCDRSLKLKALTRGSTTSLNAKLCDLIQAKQEKFATGLVVLEDNTVITVQAKDRKQFVTEVRGNHLVIAGGRDALGRLKREVLLQKSDGTFKSLGLLLHPSSNLNPKVVTLTETLIQAFKLNAAMTEQVLLISQQKLKDGTVKGLEAKLVHPETGVVTVFNLSQAEQIVSQVDAQITAKKF